MGLFAMEGVSKRFGGVRALSSADIAIEKMERGENSVAMWVQVKP